MLTYQELNSQLQGRNQESKKYANNTYIQRRGENIAMLYHDTDVVTWYPDGDVILDSGGWHTITTKERINWAIEPEYRLTQQDRIWRVNGARYQDGMVIKTNGNMVGIGQDNPKADKAIKKQVKAYAKLCAETVPLDKPNGGDCWYCSMVTVEDHKPLGDAMKDNGHIISHMDEGYVVPSLVYHALQAHYNAPMAFWTAFKDTGWTSDDRHFGRQAVSKAVYKYVITRMGFAV